MTHKMIIHDAKEFAGVFYEKNRSAKFRASWPNQMHFVNTCWNRFVEHVRAAYAEMLTRHDVPQHQKDKIYDALIADAQTNRSFEAEAAQAPLQIAPNTQTFEGDRKENAATDANYGKHAAIDVLPKSRKRLMGSTRRFN